MKLALCLLALVAGASAIQPLLGGLDGEWELWKETYEKVYESTAHEAERFEVYKANRQLVIKHNIEADRDMHTFTLEMNALADLTNDEYRTQMLGAKGSPMGGSAAFVNTNDAPDSWDWREGNTSYVVGPVKNQAQCGSCWAFSAVATMEGAYALQQGAYSSFSEQELVDCVLDGADTCSIGGEMYDGAEYGVTKGMMSESDYPYKGTSGNACGLDASKVVTKFGGYTNITSGDEDALKTATFKQPTISVGIDASSFFFQLYSGGVYNQKSCKNAIDQLDHGVAVVGYGTDPKGGDFWWVRNSWAASWGLKGYIMMSRNADNQCGIATQAMFATM